MILLGLAGPAGCGKDTIAVRLEKGYNFGHMKFADTLYRSASLMLGVDLTQMDREEKERVFDDPYLSRLGVSPRQVLQLMGTEFGRGLIHPDIWVILMERKLHYHMSDPLLENQRGIVISDVRFENEAKMIRDRGGVIAHVRRAVEPIPDSGHASEAGVQVEPTDALIPNTGTVADLYSLIEEWINDPSVFSGQNQ